MTYLEKALTLFPDKTPGQIVSEECPLDIFKIPIWEHQEFCRENCNCYSCWKKYYKGEETL